MASLSVVGVAGVVEAHNRLRHSRSLVRIALMAPQILHGPLAERADVRSKRGAAGMAFAIAVRAALAGVRRVFLEML